MATVFESNLNNLIEQKSLKWIFVGGKGGVGKTTTACSVATMLASHRSSVLIVSTDPAHNLSDAFGQKFSSSASRVEGFDNLFAMEIEAKMEMPGDDDIDPTTKSLWTEVMASFPGIDEAMSFAEIMKQVQLLQYDVIVFDTAPTGHTLRLLNLPSVLEKAVGKLMKVKSKFSGIFEQLSGSMGGASEEKVVERLEDIKADLTTFVCVCIPEFLSMYETERLVQELAKFQIDTHNIVVNQVLFVDKDSTCKQCLARSRLQRKYIEQILDLYEDFNVTLLPLLEDEILAFSKLLTDPPKYE